MSDQLRITASIATLALIFAVLSLVLNVINRQDTVRQQHEINELRQVQDLTK